MVITATYSADDNKLRLTASSRLDADTYARISAAGFSWAPKLEQFIAPAWTPEREDLALELAGEILDEDSTLMDRAGNRAERFEGYSNRRMAEAERAKAAISAIADNIPLGQPILVGHHSERHARKDAKRIHNGMRKAVDLWRTSQYWSDRAAAAVRHAKYKELPAVRARRIKTLEADKRKKQRERSEAEMWLRLWNSIDNPDSIKRGGEQISLEERARFVANRCHLTVARSEDGTTWSAWDVLRPDEERYARCPAMTVHEVQETARKAYPVLMAHCDRWIVHLDNRLVYERAMLAETGYVEPPKKKSRADLPILNYGRTISYRNPYSQEMITGEAAGLTKAQWAAINNDYKGTRVSACGTHRVRTTMMAPGHKHSLVAVYLTDSKIHDRPREDEIASKRAEEEQAAEELLEARLARAEASQREQEAERPDAAGFLALEHAAKAGVQVATASQLFPTPLNLAARMVVLAEMKPGQRVLEPSAGTGNLLRAVFTSVRPSEVVAVEIDPRLVEASRGNDMLSRVEFLCADFLACNTDLGTFDRIVMNPPFVNGADIKHIEHAATMLRPGGILVALCANGPRQQEALKDRADLWEDLPPGSFNAAGTNVNVALLLIRAHQ